MSKEILANAESKHPIILLPGINSDDVKAIIDFMYHGELNNVNYDNFKSILKTAETLKICGLMEVSILLIYLYTFIISSSGSIVIIHNFVGY